MSHKSESAKRLDIRSVQFSRLTDLPAADFGTAEVWLFVPRLGRTGNADTASDDWFKALGRFAETLNQDSLVAILASPREAAETWLHVKHILHFQLWVAVKSEKTETRPSHLSSNHAALLIMSKYRASLRHTKTRIGYMYCPHCDRTTKDYGGKKHTYHEYGTLLSDVWRDIIYSPGEHPTEIVNRLADLFGMNPYRRLVIANVALGISRPAPKEPEALISKSLQSRLHSRLINGDCLATLSSLATESVDFCFADPPYNLAKRYDSWDDAIALKDYLKWCDSWLELLARILRPGRTCAVLNIPILAIEHFKQMKRSLNFQHWIAWEGLSLPVRMIMPAHYAIVCFSKGKPRPLPGFIREPSTHYDVAALTTFKQNYCLRQSCIASRKKARTNDREQITDLWWDIHRLKHNSRRVDHPCQLPPFLMHRLISMFTYEGEIVLDPFNGAGTTTLSAEILGRRYIGIELSEKYHHMAEGRHKLLRSGGDPFEKTLDVPAAKNSRVRRIGGTKYEIPKRTLQLEVRRVAHVLGRLPSRQELAAHSRYSMKYYDEYFVSWGEVCAAARTTGMSERRSQGLRENSDQFALWND